MSTESSSSSSVPGELTAEENARISPPPPSGLRVASATPGAVRLAWTPPADVAGAGPVVRYRVYRRTAGELELRPIGTTSDTEYVDVNTASGRTYEYGVSSIRQTNREGSPGETVTATVR